MTKKRKPKRIAKDRHYKTGKIEAVDFIYDQNLGFMLGNVVKYVARCRHKGTPLADLEKARSYLNRVIRGIKSGKIDVNRA